MRVANRWLGAPGDFVRNLTNASPFARARRLDLIGFLCGLAALREKQKQSLAKAQSRKGKYVRFWLRLCRAVLSRHCPILDLQSLNACEGEVIGHQRQAGRQSVSADHEVETTTLPL
jgi:hypothetical protein